MQNQIVVITGSTRGFGHAIAEEMLKAGATVILNGRSLAGVRRAIKALKRLGRVTGVVCDVQQERQVYAMARRVVKEHGRIDVWINNAGLAAGAGTILDTGPAQAIDMFMTNDMGVLHGTRAALHFMLKRKEGTLVNIYGHGSFLRPATPTALYGATKAWMTSFTRSLAKEIMGSGVRLVGFSPGMLLTELLTAPIVIGEHGRDMMKNYAFVLRFLGGSPNRAAKRLVSLLESNRKPFVEHQIFKPWTPLLGLLRVAWENITHTGKTPEFKMKFRPAYRAKI